MIGHSRVTRSANFLGNLECNWLLVNSAKMKESRHLLFVIANAFKARI